MKKFGPWIKGLSIIQKVLLTFGVLILIGAVSGDNKKANLNSTNSANKQSTAQKESTNSQAAPKAEVITKTVTETQEIPYNSTTVNDSTVSKGTNKVTTPGVNGIKTLTYKVTYTDGVQTDKQLIGEEVTTPPINQVTSIGTYVAPKPKSSSCDPNYSGGCVPIASDVDCGGGSGNGPAYFYGTATVVGYDLYDLDRDNDGLACE